MRRILSIATLLILALCGSHAASIIVPENAIGVEGRSNVNAAFLLRGRIQHVVNASNFAGFGPIEIEAISLKCDSVFWRDINVTFPNLTITASTTQRFAQGLSRFYAENIGPDVQSVLSGAYTLIANGGPAQFATSFAFDRPFLYDPELGNLLLELVFVDDPIGEISPYSAFDRIGSSEGSGTNSVSGLWSDDPFAASTSSLPNDPPIMAITYTAVPEPAGVSTASLALVALFASRKRNNGRTRARRGVILFALPPVE